jgi:iron complex outermembrane receptor protein
LWNVAPGWQLTSNLAYSERAPKDYELFADGPHIATNAYEVGNANFTKEQSTNLDVGVQWKSGANRFGVSAFVNQFNNYIALDGTGINRDTDGNFGVGGAGTSVTDSGNGDNTSAESGGTAGILPEFAYTQVAARFTGLEASGNIRLIESTHTLDLELRGDLVRAVNSTTGQSLARIAPTRLGATLVWVQGPWGARFGVNHVAAQNDVGVGQPATAAYTLLNAAVHYRHKAGAASLLWFAKVDNLTDVLAYSASSILTQTAPGKSPLGGRSVKLGLQVNF